MYLLNRSFFLPQIAHAPCSLDSLPSITHQAGGYTGNNRVLGNIVSDDRSGTHNGLGSDVHTRQDTGVHPNIRAESDRDRFDHQGRRYDGFIIWLARVSRTQDLCTRSPTHIVFQNQVPSIKVGLWPNPNMTSDLAHSIESPLDHSLRSNEDAVAKLHGLWVFQDDVGSHLKIVANAFAQRPHENATHHRVKAVFSCSKAREEVEQLFFGMRISQEDRKVLLPGRVLPLFTAAEGGFDLPDAYFYSNAWFGVDHCRASVLLIRLQVFLGPLETFPPLPAS